MVGGLKFMEGAEQPRHAAGFEAAAEQKAHFPPVLVRFWALFPFISTSIFSSGTR